jgi:hypothetical protein
MGGVERAVRGGYILVILYDHRKPSFSIAWSKSTARIALPAQFRIGPGDEPQAIKKAGFSTGLAQEEIRPGS